jgi:multisubunit Na+/H+ antiporter MnhE subunit
VPGPGDRFAALTEILLWWVLTTAVWLVTVTPLTAAELAVAAGCTLPCAVAVLAFAATPGTVVLDSDPDEGTVLLHRIRPRTGRLATAVQR